MLKIRRLHSINDWIKAFPVIKQLRTHLEEASYLANKSLKKSKK